MDIDSSSRTQNEDKNPPGGGGRVLHGSLGSFISSRCVGTRDPNASFPELLLRVEFAACSLEKCGNFPGLHKEQVS